MKNYDEGMIYFIQQGEDAYFKIGRTQSNTKKRLIGLQTGNPKRLRIYGKVRSYNVLKDEDDLHIKYYRQRQEGEWFNLTPYQIENEIESWGDKGELLIRTPKPISAFKRIGKFISNNKAIFFMYLYIQLLALNSSYVAIKKYIVAMPESFYIQAALTLIICSQLLYWFFFGTAFNVIQKLKQ